MASSISQEKCRLLRMEDDELQDFLDEKLEEVGIDDISAVQEICPSTPIQEGIQLSRMDPSGPDYNVVATISVDPVRENDAVSASRVRLAWQRVVDRHPILRTVFVESVEYGRFSDQIVLSQWTADVREAETLRDPPEALEFPANQPAHRLTLARTGRGSVRCRLEIDHTLTDGISVAIAMRDLADAYVGELPSTRQQPPPRYSEYVAFLQNEDGEAHLRYWARRLSGARPCLFPTARASLGDAAADDVRSAAAAAVLVPGLRSSLLHAFCSKLNVTLFNLVQAAWALVLRSYTGADDVCFGYVTAGRDLPVGNVKEIMGPLINTLVCRAQVGGGGGGGGGGTGSVPALVRSMQGQFLESAEHQTTSLGSIYNVLRIEGRRLFNTAVTFRPLHLDTIGNDVVSLSLIGRKSYSEFDITVSLERSDRVEISLHYSSRKFSKEAMTVIASALSQTLNMMPRSSKLPAITPKPLA